MNRRKSNGNRILEILIEDIIINLNELFEVNNPSEFNEGGRYAYLECLEIISGWSDYSKYGITEIEEKYPIK